MANAAAAHAAPSYNESNWAASVSGSQPSDAICVGLNQGTTRPIAAGCFKRYGDQWWVGHDLKRGEVVTLEWENYLRAPDSGGYSYWKIYRTGYCYLDTPGWGVCNKDYYEHSSTNYYGMKGSEVYWRVCVRGQCSQWEVTYNDQ
ncbi:hypothetical protein GCM10011608_02400 [Micromonospora sonchi]|uniref:Uncharacterized protein n=2 Tax=Micromonospora sonchi TaxID=1763543 RepID=A0A917TFW6_9ACTN|nr:hypothetical protein GCM10011608_02400 [Micromonospora sonchi]